MMCLARDVAGEYYVMGMCFVCASYYGVQDSQVYMLTCVIWQD